MDNDWRMSGDSGQPPAFLSTPPSTQRGSLERHSRNYSPYGATGQAGWIDDYIFDKVILLGEDGAPFLSHYAQKAHVVNGKSWGQNHAHVLKPISNLTLALYVGHYLNIFDYQGYVTGTTRLKLNQSSMVSMPFPLAPLNEQQRIVDAIETHFTRLGPRRWRPPSVPRPSCHATASVLKAACEGRLAPHMNDEPADLLLARILTERPRSGRRRIRGKKYVEPAVPVPDGLPELPVGWCSTNGTTNR